MSDARTANLNLLDEANLAATPCQWCFRFGHQVKDCPVHTRMWVQIIAKQGSSKPSLREKVLNNFWWFAMGLMVGALVGKGWGA